VDQRTIEAAQRGDRRAQAVVLHELQDIWFRFCLSQLGSADSARDATQETALRFLKALSGFRGQSRVETWSLGIALNVIREMRRSAASVQRVREIDRPETGEDSPVHVAELNDSTDQLRALLDDLPERQREALALRFFEDLSVEETATAMNCATGTVKATVHQALRTLRTKMTKTLQRRTRFSDAPEGRVFPPG
jgi:RNA polymerase sigma-70 factor, ECF subfamily